MLLYGFVESFRMRELLQSEPSYRLERPSLVPLRCIITSFVEVTTVECLLSELKLLKLIGSVSFLPSSALMTTR